MKIKPNQRARIISDHNCPFTKGCMDVETGCIGMEVTVIKEIPMDRLAVEFSDGGCCNMNKDDLEFIKED